VTTDLGTRRRTRICASSALRQARPDACEEDNDQPQLVSPSQQIGTLFEQVDRQRNHVSEVDCAALLCSQCKLGAQATNNQQTLILSTAQASKQ
jgi:hypothetical protein